MPSDAVDFRSRAQLTELMDEPCSREELRGALHDIARLNRWFLAYRPVLDWLGSILDGSHPLAVAEPIRIVDVGCGYGDGLRRIERWARARGIAVELTGLDVSPDAVVIAREASPPECGIRWVAADIFAYRPEKPVDLVISSQFTHHLGENDIVRFLEWMERNAELGWFINDLSRAAVPYRFLQIFARVARLHHIVRNDGPVSIARAFVPEDWQRMSAAAGLNASEVTVRGFKPARLCVSRRKPTNPRNS